jgi:hypothetical protein
MIAILKPPEEERSARLTKPSKEYIGILEKVEPFCRGLVMAKIGKKFVILPEGLPLQKFVGQKIGIANVYGNHSMRVLKGD